MLAFYTFHYGVADEGLLGRERESDERELSPGGLRAARSVKSFWGNDFRDIYI